MPRLEDYQKDLLKMNPEELRARIREIRADRVIRKETPRTKSARVKTQDRAKTTAVKIMDSIDPETLAAMLKDMGMEDN